MRYQGHEYPLRVTKYDDGFYRWSVEMEGAPQYEIYKNLIKISSVITLCIMGGMAVMSLGTPYFGEMMLEGLGVFAGIVVLPALIMWLIEKRGKGIYQRFEMNDDYIKLVGYSAKTTRYVHFKHIRKIKVNEHARMLWVLEALSGVQVFVGRDDFIFVLQYLQEKTNGEAKIIII